MSSLQARVVSKTWNLKILKDCNGLHFWMTQHFKTQNPVRNVFLYYFCPLLKDDALAFLPQQFSRKLHQFRDVRCFLKIAELCIFTEFSSPFYEIPTKTNKYSDDFLSWLLPFVYIEKREFTHQTIPYKKDQRKNKTTYNKARLFLACPIILLWLYNCCQVEWPRPIANSFQVILLSFHLPIMSQRCWIWPGRRSDFRLEQMVTWPVTVVTSFWPTASTDTVS